MHPSYRFACLLLALASPPALAETPAAAPAPVVVTALRSAQATDIGQPLVLPQVAPQVSFSEYLIQPGAVLPVHKHPFARYAYVLEGRLQVSRPGHAESSEYRAGDVVIEMIDEWHFGTNIGEVPLRLLVIDQVEAGSPATVLRKD